MKNSFVGDRTIQVDEVAELSNHKSGRHGERRAAHAADHELQSLPTRSPRQASSPLKYIRNEKAPLLVTKTLLFGGDGSGMFLRLPGGGGPTFRAYDKKTGRVLHVDRRQRFL